MSVRTARMLRRRMTDAEQALWRVLRDRGLGGYRFRRQEPIGPYVADFCCRAEYLIIEVDGGQHGVQVEADAARTRWLEARGYRVLRFWNNDVLRDVEAVATMILAALDKPDERGDR